MSYLPWTCHLFAIKEPNEPWFRCMTVDFNSFSCETSHHCRFPSKQSPSFLALGCKCWVEQDDHSMTRRDTALSSRNTASCSDLRKRYIIMKNCESPRKTLVACIGDAQSALQCSFRSQKKHDVNQVLLVSDEPAVANRVSGHYVIAETEVRISFCKPCGTSPCSLPSPEPQPVVFVFFASTHDAIYFHLIIYTLMLFFINLIPFLSPTSLPRLFHVFGFLSTQFCRF